jgi:hypothetical protein
VRGPNPPESQAIACDAIPPHPDPLPPEYRGEREKELPPRDSLSPDRDLDRQARQLAATLTWLGPTPFTAADLIAALPQALRARTRARHFLATFLKDAPRPSTDVAAAARAEGIAIRTLRRAAQDLKIGYRKIGNQVIGQTVFWLLPGQTVPKDALDPNGLDYWLERLDNPRGGNLPNLPERTLTTS